ncbi:hypothetical protein B0H11DRAFT_2248503 [Mycena galericulata]|nr:hypothetical protein B0H11DRAFT_2248503 [Mycena galericulata]
MAVEFTIPLAEFLPRILHVPPCWMVENACLIEEISTAVNVVQRLRECIEADECSKAFSGLANQCIRLLKRVADDFDFSDVFVIRSQGPGENFGTSKLECTEAAGNFLSNSRRRHIFGVLLSHDSLEFVCYDRAVVVKCEPVRFAEETASFLAVLLGLHSTRFRQRSYSSAESKLPFFCKRTGGLIGMEMQSETISLHSRMLPITIQNEIKPLNLLTSAGDLAEALRAIFESYRSLYETAKILHRDISLNNLMYRTDGDKIYGVLRESDATLPLTALPSSSKRRRAGTKLFIAIDLLAPNPPVHLYRHDLESFLYVLVFLTRKIKGSKLAQWDFLDRHALKLEKTMVMLGDDSFPPSKANFESFRIWIFSMMILFIKGFQARIINMHHREMSLSMRTRMPPVQDFDDDTLGGHVTFDKFAAILQTPIVLEL